MAQTKTEKIENLKKEIEQLQNKQKRLLQEQKIQERKDRTKRLCRRAGLLESLLPETIPLSEEQFKSFFEKVLLSEYARKMLNGVTEQTADITAPTPAETEQDGDNDGDE